MKFSEKLYLVLALLFFFGPVALATSDAVSETGVVSKGKPTDTSSKDQDEQEMDQMERELEREEAASPTASLEDDDAHEAGAPAAGARKAKVEDNAEDLE